jgi:hypothetical protein
MVSRSLLTSVLVVGSVITAPAVFAQQVNVDFTATVPSACTVLSNTPGTLGVYTPDGNSRLLSSGGWGTPGVVTVNCNQTALVTVDNVVQTASPSDPDPVGTAIAAIVWNNTNATLAQLSPGFSQQGSVVLNQNDLYVDLDVNRVPAGASFQGGSYAYQVQFTIAP